MEDFLLGAIGMGSMTAALFFLRFFRDTGDRLFAIFAASFFLLGVSRVGLCFSQGRIEGETHWYWFRLAAFLLILVAIIDKNRR